MALTLQETRSSGEQMTIARGQAKSSRISWVDHARGIAIMLVVYRHVVIGIKRSGVPVSDFLYNIQEVFYNFRMPVFFLLSGIFVAGSLKKRTRLAVLKDRAFTVLYPYLVWAVIMVTLEIVFSRFANSKRSWRDLTYIITDPRAIDHLWYLFALFNTSALYLLLSKWINPGPAEPGSQTRGKARVSIQIWLHMAIAIGLHAITFASFLQGNSLVSDAFYFYPYFLIGTLVSSLLTDREKSDKYLNSKNLLWVFPLFLIGQWFWFTHREEKGAFFPLVFVINLVACYFIYILSHQIALRGNDWLSWLGKYSLYIYILHVPVAAIIRNVLSHSGIGAGAWMQVLVCWLGGLFIPVLLYTFGKRFGFDKLFSLKQRSGA